MGTVEASLRNTHHFILGNFPTSSFFISAFFPLALCLFFFFSLSARCFHPTSPLYRGDYFGTDQRERY